MYSVDVFFYNALQQHSHFLQTLASNCWCLCYNHWKMHATQKLCSVIFYAMFYGTPISLNFQLNETDFHDSLLLLGFSPEVCKSLTSMFLSHFKETKAALSKIVPTLPVYGNLEWRFDIKVNYSLDGHLFVTENELPSFRLHWRLWFHVVHRILWYFCFIVMSHLCHIY